MSEFWGSGIEASIQCRKCGTMQRGQWITALRGPGHWITYDHVGADGRRCHIYDAGDVKFPASPPPSYRDGRPRRE